MWEFFLSHEVWRFAVVLVRSAQRRCFCNTFNHSTGVMAHYIHFCCLLISTATFVFEFSGEPRLAIHGQSDFPLRNNETLALPGQERLLGGG